MRLWAVFFFQIKICASKSYISKMIQKTFEPINFEQVIMKLEQTRKMYLL